MADYLAECVFQLEDKASNPLKKFIGNVETAHKALTNFNALLGTTSKLFEDLKLAGIPIATMFGDISKEMTGVNTRMTNLGKSSVNAAKGMDTFAKAGLQTTFVMADVATEAERVATTMETAAKATMAAGAAATSAGRGFRKFGAGSAGAGGGAGSRIAEEGILSRMAGGVFGTALNTLIGIDIAKAGLRPAMEYQQTVLATRMMGGLSGGDMKTVQQLAANVSDMVPGTTMTQNIESFKELYGVFGNKNMAAKLLPDFAKMRIALAVAGGKMPELHGHEDQIATMTARAAEMFGKSGSPEDMREFMSKILRVQIATGGTVKPEAFKQVGATLRTARYGKDDEFLFGVLPYFIQEMASKSGAVGGRTGPMFQNLNRMLAGGVMTKQVAKGLVDLGILPGGTDLKTSSIHTLIQGHKLKGAELFQRNPFEWATQVLKTSIEDKSGMKRGGFNKLSDTKQMEVINRFAGSAPGTALDALTQMLLMEKQIRRHIDVFGKVPGMNELYNESLGTTAIKLQEVNAQFNNLLTTLGKSETVMTPINAGLDALIGGLQGLNRWFGTLDLQMKDLVSLNPGLSKFTVELGALLSKLLGVDPGTPTGNINEQFKQQRTAAVGLGAAGGAIAGSAIGAAVSGPFAPLGFVAGGAIGAGIGGGSILSATAPPPALMRGMNKQHSKWLEKHGFKFNGQGFDPTTSRMTSNDGLVPPPPPVAANLNQLGPAMGGSDDDLSKAAAHLSQASSHLVRASQSRKLFNPLKAWEKSAIIDGAVGTGGGGHYAQSHFTEPTTGSH